MRKSILISICSCVIAASTRGCQVSFLSVAGAPGIGDPYYPNMGNGGYDVQSYTIALDIDPPANTINGSTIIQATSTKHLKSFNLDFHGLTIDSVRVNDNPAEFSRQDDELTIIPSVVLKSDHPFMVVVDYHGVPELITSKGLQNQRGVPGQIGWSHMEDGTINVLAAPDGASSWFPNNDHPLDKASFRFEITVPKPWVVAATGTLKETKDTDDKTLYVWEMDHPMATYLASINIGQYKLYTRPGPDGVTIRSYFPSGYPSSLQSNFDVLPDAMDFFNGLFGPYPFMEYGVVIAGDSKTCETIGALEAQSLSVHCPKSYAAYEWVIVHELAHQWFGDSVSLENWRDIWLKEGLATYAEWLWQSKNDPARLSEIVKLQDGAFYFDSSRSVAEPAPDDLYTVESFIGAGMIFHALHQQLGDETFFKILQTYTHRYQYGNAGTDEFIAIAEEVSRQDLNEFFEEWLFDQSLPNIPE